MAYASKLSKTMGLIIGAELLVRRVSATGFLPEGCLSRRISLVDRGMVSPSIKVSGTISSSFSTPPLVFLERYLKALLVFPFIIKYLKVQPTFSLSGCFFLGRGIFVCIVLLLGVTVSCHNSKVHLRSVDPQKKR